MKKCSTCNETLEHSSFSKRAKSKDGLASSCKKCQKEVNRRSYERYRQNPNSKQLQKVANKDCFLTKYPLLSGNWDFHKNIVQPHEISSRNSYKAYWVCSTCSFQWEARLNKITTKGDRIYCPACDGRTPTPVIASDPNIILWVKDVDSINLLSKNSKKLITFICPINSHTFQISLKKFAFLCPVCTFIEKSVSSVAPHLVPEWDTRNHLSPLEVSYASAKEVSWVCEKGHEWRTPVYQRVGGKTGCPQCSAAKFQSSAEQEILEYVKSVVSVKVVTSDRIVLSGQELDIYIPDKQIAIEYNGLYWHSEAQGKDKWYHYNKWLKCKEQGIQLIQIWEDDWKRNPYLIKLMLYDKLRVSSNMSFAEETIPVLVTQGEANIFLERNHIYGVVDGIIRAALLHEKEIVSLIVLDNESGSSGEVLTLLCFSTNRYVQDAFSKLLSYVWELYPEVNKIVTFSDNDSTDGTLYEESGFVQIDVVDPDYSYLNKKVREHKSNYMISRFKNDPGLKFVEGFSESELAELNNLHKIWDCGKIKWKLTR